MNNPSSLKLANQLFSRKKYLEALSAYRDICRKHPELKRIVQFNIEITEKAILGNDKSGNLKISTIAKANYHKSKAYTDILDNYDNFTKLPMRAQLLILKAV